MKLKYFIKLDSWMLITHNSYICKCLPKFTHPRILCGLFHHSLLSPTSSPIVLGILIRSQRLDF